MALWLYGHRALWKGAPKEGIFLFKGILSYGGVIIYFN
jgi:hypothetical protein